MPTRLEEIHYGSNYWAVCFWIYAEQLLCLLQEALVD